MAMAKTKAKKAPRALKSFVMDAFDCTRWE
jgi:hypothetical protein